MSINATTSSTSSSQISSASTSDNAQKSSTDSSFKDEMNKVSSSEKKDDNKVDNVDKKSEIIDKSKVSEKNSDKEENQEFDKMFEANADYSKYASMAMMDVNSMLANDIAQMVNSNAFVNPTGEVSEVSGASLFSAQNSISMTESDADFFINLTQNNDISMQNITAQAQNMLNQGAEVQEVKQNVQISQTLLNAINAAKENNQPLRIDFDQNVSVILRINKDGVISANFIPGDKAVEQYLRNNIDNLKATFNENDLPYTDLSYSNRGKQQQKEERRNRQQ